MTYKVSVIIPFYNGIEYLPACVASVQNQTLREIEILLVDDGSTDGSGELADTLAAGDERIRVLHQENRGVSAARNAALSIAQGEYIGFVDADDIALPEMYETLYVEAQEKRCDIVSCAFSSFDDSGLLGNSAPSSAPGDMLTHEKIVQKIPTMSTDRTFQFIWRRIFSAALVQKNAVRFDPEISIGEDTLFCMDCFLHAARAVAIQNNLYMYRHQPNSTLRKRGYKPNLLRSLSKQYEKKHAACTEYCPEQEQVFLRDSAQRSVSDTLPLAISNVFRKPHGQLQEFRVLLRTPWVQDTLRYAELSRSRSLDRIALRCMQKKMYFCGFCIAKLVFGKDKHNG